MKILKVAKTKPIWNETHLLLLRLRQQIPFSQLIELTSGLEYFWLSYFRLNYFRLSYFRSNQLPMWRTAELPVRKRKQLSERNKIFCLLYLPPTWINFVLYLLLLDNFIDLILSCKFRYKYNLGHCWSKLESINCYHLLLKLWGKRISFLILLNSWFKVKTIRRIWSLKHLIF